MYEYVWGYHRNEKKKISVRWIFKWEREEELREERRERMFLRKKELAGNGLMVGHSAEVHSEFHSTPRAPIRAITLTYRHTFTIYNNLLTTSRWLSC